MNQNLQPFRLSGPDIVNAARRAPLAVKLFCLIVLLPTLIAAIYNGLLRSDIYIAEAKYALRINTGSSPGGFLQTVVYGTGMESAVEDTTIVRDFIYSREMVEALDKELGIRAHYSSRDVDVFSRLGSNDSSEEFVEYYRGMVGMGIDTTTNITTIRVRAFEPQMAHDMTQTIIRLSEELVNKLSKRIVDDTLSFARTEVENAEQRVISASQAMTRFRTDTNSINPGEETKAVIGIITQLEGQLAAARTQLIEARSYMQSDSQQVKMLTNKVDALEKQVEQERKRLSDPKDKTRNYTDLIDSFQPLMLEQEMATKQYASTLTSMEAARVEALRKQRYLLPFVPPKVPDEAVEPQRIRATVTVFISLCIFYAIGALVWAAIKDHMRI